MVSEVAAGIGFVVYQTGAAELVIERCFAIETLSVVAEFQRQTAVEVEIEVGKGLVVGFGRQIAAAAAEAVAKAGLNFGV